MTVLKVPNDRREVERERESGDHFFYRKLSCDELLVIIIQIKSHHVINFNS